MRREKGVALRILFRSLLRGMQRVSITGSVTQALEKVWSLQPKGGREKKREWSGGERGRGKGEGNAARAE